MDSETAGERERTAEECPDGGYGWVIVGATFILYANSIGLSLNIGIFTPHIVQVYT